VPAGLGFVAHLEDNLEALQFGKSDSLCFFVILVVDGAEIFTIQERRTGHVVHFDGEDGGLKGLGGGEGILSLAALVLVDITREPTKKGLLLGNKLDRRQILSGQDGVTELGPDNVEKLGVEVPRPIIGTSELTGEDFNDRAEDDTERIVEVDTCWAMEGKAR
jgi:hypothetical protein